MTVETEVGNLTTAVNRLTEAVNVSKATLDASVADAEAAQSAASSSATTASGHATSAAASAAAAASTASGLAGFDLGAIAATKAVTAVDVFVYDTSKDSDGGAWRKRCQHTSWYNEPLNTAIRGSRREFPAVAVIVAETNKVTIYDGDDPSLPMWMVFNRSTTSGVSTNATMIGDSLQTVSAVGAINGNLISAGVSGFCQINFVSDSGLFRGAVSARTYGGNVAGRNFEIGFPTVVSGILVNSTVNDVAMTVLPDAPIDPATGLPVPTIAVATAGGVSVIKDDGNVWDIGTGSAYKAVSFDNQRLWISDDYTVQAGPIPTADITIASWRDWYGQNTAGDLPYYGSLIVDTDKQALASSQKLVQYYEDLTNISGSLIAYTTSTYNTGWMNGDIKGAFLSDTDDTDLVGSDAAVDGSFANAGIWTLQNGASIAGGDLSFAGTGFAIAQTNQTTGAGEQFYLEFTVSSISGGALNAGIRNSANTAFLAQSASISSAGTYGFWVTTDAASNLVRFSANNTSTVATIDSWSFYPLDADRSVNNKGLIVNGTVTRTAVATGAELVAYSGFSASNYLEQPYNSALDFGTGDFCVMGWAKVNNVGGSKYIIARASHDGTSFSGAGIVLRFDGSEFPVFGISDDGFATSDSVTYSSALTGRWAYVAGIRRGSVLELYVDGGLVGTTAITAATGSLNNTAAVLSVGNLSGLLTIPMDGSLALLRISATAPTASQIAKIYEDEKMLFQENAACTLYGTSDAVTALAHDSDTGLLHVGTSAGRSVFSGLRRVSNTTTAVGTAISASNGLIAEE